VSTPVSTSRDELLARTLVVLFAFVFFFTFNETGARAWRGKIKWAVFQEKGYGEDRAIQEVNQDMMKQTKSECS
jgi:hypothetical protein